MAEKESSFQSEQPVLNNICDFDEAMREYDSYKTRIAALSIQDMDEQFPDNQIKLQKIVYRLEKSFPKDAGAAEHYAVFEAYRRLERETLSNEQCGKWLMHAKKFVKTCPDKFDGESLYRVMDSLPDITSDCGVIFDYSRLAWEKMDPKYVLYPRGREMVEKAAENYYNDLGWQGNTATDKREKLKCFEKQSKVLTYVPPLRRIPLHRENIKSLSRFYNLTEAGRHAIGRRQSVQFNRVWKSLPLEVKNMYRQQAWNYK